MKLLGKKLLHDFKRLHADVRSQIDSWEAEVAEAQWKSPQDLKGRYPKASILKNQLVVFNIGGNKYRLLVQVNFRHGMVLIKKIGSHKEYDKWKIS